MTRDELIELVRRVIEVRGTEEEIGACIQAVSRAVPHPSWTDLIYYGGRDLSPEQVVDGALAYTPIRTGPVVVAGHGWFAAPERRGAHLPARAHRLSG